MSGFKRRKVEAPVPERTIETPIPEQAPERAKPMAETADSGAAGRIEQSLVAVLAQLENLTARMQTIELRLEDMTDQLEHVPSHSDVMEVRMHGAKLAAELARSTVELRGEIGMANDEARRAARAVRATETAAVQEPTVDVVDHSEQRPHPFSQTA